MNMTSTYNVWNELYGNELRVAKAILEKIDIVEYNYIIIYSYLKFHKFLYFEFIKYEYVLNVTMNNLPTDVPKNYADILFNKHNEIFIDIKKEIQKNFIKQCLPLFDNNIKDTYINNYFHDSVICDLNVLTLVVKYLK